MKIAFNWDDGSPEDIKLFHLHEKYCIPGIFFVPNFNSEGRDVLRSEDIKAASSDLISFGGHTKNHVYLPQISPSLWKQEIVDNKKYLEEITNKPIKHFSYPGGRYNSDIQKIVFEQFVTTRTADTMNFKFPKGNICRPTFHMYYRGIKSIIGNCVRNCSFSEGVFFAINKNHDYFELIKKFIDMNSDKNEQIVIWGHSWELEKFDLWQKIDDLMSWISKNEKKSICSYDDLFR